MAERVLTYLSEIETASPNVGYGLIGAYALVYTGLAVRIKFLPAARAADPELTAFGKDLPGMVPVSPLQVHHHGPRRTGIPDLPKDSDDSNRQYRTV